MVRQEQMDIDMSALDQSLDEVMAANKKKRGQGKGKGKAKGRGRGRGFKRNPNSGKASPPQRNRSRGGKGGYRGRRGRGFRNTTNGGRPNRANALNRSKQFKRVWGYPNNGRGGSRRSNMQAPLNRQRFGQKPYRNGQSFSTTGKVVVTNLKPHVSSDDIKEIFEKFGTVTQAYVKFDANTGASTGTAEVFYARGADARNAQLELDGAKIDEGVIRVSYGGGGSPRNRRRGAKGRGKGQFNNPLQRQTMRMDMY